MNKPSRIAVVGGGVLGLSVAHFLSINGADVSIFERNHIGTGTSTKTFAWVNSNGKNPESYHLLNAASMVEHIALQKNAGSQGEWLIQSGTYEWTKTAYTEDRLAKRVEKLLSYNYPVQSVRQQELQNQIPEIRIDPQVGEIRYFPSECLLYPSIFMAHLWGEAQKCGAKLYNQSDVTNIYEDEHGAKLTTADGKSWEGDRIVIATGRWSQDLMNSLGLKLAIIDANQPNKIACGFLVQTSPLLVQLRSNLITPELNVRPEGGGRLLLQAPDLDHFANPAIAPDIDGYIGQEFLHRLRRLFSNTETARIEHIAIGQRARPADGLPGVGYLTANRKIYLVVSHSGMTLAPLLGKLVAHEVITGERSELLTDFSPDRLIGKPVEDFPAISTIYFPAGQ